LEKKVLLNFSKKEEKPTSASHQNQQDFADETAKMIRTKNTNILGYILELKKS
jgi:hypothetical protein